MVTKVKTAAPKKDAALPQPAAGASETQNQTDGKNSEQSQTAAPASNQAFTETANQGTGDQAPAAAPTPPAKKDPVKALVIAAKAEGFRRAGRAWSATETTVPLDEFSADQVEQLKAEPMLTVIEIERPAE